MDTVATTRNTQAPPAPRGGAPRPSVFRRVGTILVAPSVLVLLLWMIVPLVMTLWFSFQRYNLVDPTVSGFAGADNYLYLFTDPDFWVSLRNTLVLLAAVPLLTGHELYYALRCWLDCNHQMMHRVVNLL